MTTIKTLVDRRNEFEKWYKENYIPSSSEVWKWFESTLSELTESMIPEGKVSLNNFKDTSILELYKREGFDTCRELVKQKREELLRK